MLALPERFTPICSTCCAQELWHQCSNGLGVGDVHAAEKQGWSYEVQLPNARPQKRPRRFQGYGERGWARGLHPGSAYLLVVRVMMWV